MGASNIDIRKKGKLSKLEIEKAFKDQQESDRSENGHQQGYSGDFQTLNEVRFDVLEKGTGNYNSDYELALDKSEKWDYAQAIYTKNSKGEDITLIVGWGAS